MLKNEQIVWKVYAYNIQKISDLSFKINNYLCERDRDIPPKQVSILTQALDRLSEIRIELKNFLMHRHV